MFGKKKKYQFTLNNTTFNFDNWHEFLNLYIEIFIIQEYRFKSQKKSPVILDCGGHIGLATLYFKSRYPKAKITAFEPLPDNAHYFLKNVQTNALTGVTLVQTALGNTKRGKNTTTTFYTSGEGEPSWGNSTVKENLHSQSTQKIKVTVSNLSPFLTHKVDFLKMDIEGAEVEVLREVGASIRNVREMVVEIHNQLGNTDTLDFVTNFLDLHGFKFSVRKPVRVLIRETFERLLGRETSDIYMLRAWR